MAIPPARGRRGAREASWPAWGQGRHAWDLKPVLCQAPRPARRAYRASRVLAAKGLGMAALGSSSCRRPHPLLGFPSPRVSSSNSPAVALRLAAQVPASQAAEACRESFAQTATISAFTSVHGSTLMPKQTSLIKPSPSMAWRTTIRDRRRKGTFPPIQSLVGSSSGENSLSPVVGGLGPGAKASHRANPPAAISWRP